MVWDRFQLWLIRFAMAAASVGGLGMILFTDGFGISERGLAKTLGFGEYSLHITILSILLFSAGVVILAVFQPDDE